ncbi:MAG TPA: ABC transporter substrate-binding protein [Firmicutes bacterium]|nr:ABC transporter substrate-binding protein [Bacillota bacterium]
MKLNRRLVTFLVIALALSLIAGCATPQQPAQKEEPKKEEPKKEEPKEIVIGVITPITGDVATFGESTRNAVLLLAEQWNAKGGLLGKKIVVKVEDDRNQPQDSAAAAQKLITQDKVVGIVGSVASKCTLAAAPIAQENKIPLISGTSTNEKVTQVGDYIFRACFIDPFQGAVMARFAFNNLKAKTAACLFDVTNDYPKGLAEEFKKEFEKLGGKVVEYQTYNYGDQDFKPQLTKIKTKNPDVLFLSDYYNTVGLIAKQARELGIKSVFLGGDGWDSPDLVKIGGKAVEGGYFSNHYSPESTAPEAVEFLKAYKAKYNKDPDALAALGYDAALLLFDAIKRAGSTEGAKIRDALAATKDFKAVSGTITFDANRNPIKDAAIITIKDGQQKLFTMVKP